MVRGCIQNEEWRRLPSSSNETIHENIKNFVKNFKKNSVALKAFMTNDTNITKLQLEKFTAKDVSTQLFAMVNFGTSKHGLNAHDR